jgi:hypothetical protein
MLPIAPIVAATRGHVAAAASTLTPVFQDSFTDADATLLGSHTPDLGTAWVNGLNLANFSISGNTCINAGAGTSYAVCDDIGSADQYVFITLTTISNTAGLLYRYGDTSNFWSLYRTSGFFRLDKNVAGTTTTLATSTTALSSGAKVKVEVVGNVHNVYNDTGSGWVLDSVLNNITDSDLNTNTKAGIRANSATLAYDDFDAGTIT